MKMWQLIGGGEKSFNIQLLKYNIEFNKQEELTIVPSDGKIIISLFHPIFSLSARLAFTAGAAYCLSDEKLIFFHPDFLLFSLRLAPISKFTQWEFFYLFDRHKKSRK